MAEFGRDGGDATGADAALLAVPAGTIADALRAVTGLEGVPLIDATNAVRDPRPDGFDSFAAYAKSLTGGPVAKAFNSNFATLYEAIPQASAKPSMVFAADDDARDVTAGLITDAGYEPIYAGDLSSARAVEDFVGVIFALGGQRGPFFYRVC